MNESFEIPQDTDFDQLEQTKKHKVSIFDALGSRQAFWLGVITTLLVLSTIGFVFLVKTII